MKSGAYRFFAFAGAVAVLVALLRLLNWLPQVAEKELLRKYRDLEDARAASGIHQALAPSYFPQNLSWPPSTILAQGIPFPALVMEFERIGGKETALLISQAESEAFFPAERFRFHEVKERVPYSLKGRQALLVAGVGPQGEPCAGIDWREGKYWIVVRAKTSPIELIRIAESMIR